MRSNDFAFACVGQSGKGWSISAQHEVVRMQLAFRFQTNAETRQLIPGQWDDCIKRRALCWLECGAILGQGSTISEFGVCISKVIGNVFSRNSCTTHSQNEKKVGQVRSKEQHPRRGCFLTLGILE